MPITLGVGPVSNSSVGVTTSLALTLNGVTAGRSLVVGMMWISGSATVTSVNCTSEADLDLHTQQVAASNFGAGLANLQFASLDEVTAGGNKTITMNFSAGVQYKYLFAFEVDGADIASFFQTDNGSTGTGTNPTGAITTTKDGSLVVAMLSSATTDSTAGSGYTGYDTPNMYRDYAEYDLDAGTAGAKTPDFVNATSQDWVILAASFNPAPFSHVATGGVEIGGEADIEMVPYTHTGTGGVGVGGSAEVRLPVRRAFEIVYSLRLQAAVELPYIIWAQAANGITLRWTDHVRAAIDLVYGVRETLQKGVEVVYDLSERSPVSRAVEIAYSMRLQAAVEVTYAIRPIVRAGIDITYNILEQVRVAKEINYDLTPRNKLRVAYSTIWSLLTPFVENVTDQPVLVHQGRTVRIEEGDISASEGGYAWEGNFTLSDIADYVRFQRDDVFTAEIYGEVWTFIVDGKELRRPGPAQVSGRIIGISPSARFTNPRAPRQDYLWDEPVGAEAAALEVTGGEVDWDVVDWTIPAFRLAFSDTEPLDIVKRLAEAIGAVVESDLDGTLHVRELYPVSPQDYETTTPDHEFIEVQDIFDASETYGFNVVANRFRLMEMQQAEQDRLEWIEDAPGAFSGVMRVYPGPWRTNVTLSHTQVPGTVHIGPQAESYREEEELIEIFKGQGSTAYPVFDILEVEWEGTNLGGLAHAVDGADITVIGPEANSLVRIRYRTRCLTYRVVSSSGHPTQFLLDSATI